MLRLFGLLAGLVLLFESGYGQESRGQTDSLKSVVEVSLVDQSSQEKNGVAETTSIHPVRLGIVGGTLLGGMAAIHIYQNNGWWKDNRRSFHFQEDLKYGLSVDKIGHFYGATAMTFVIRKSLLWANLSEESALLWGAGSAAMFQTFIEVQDGFSRWGFDRVDFAMNIAGAAWPVAQYYSPFLQNFDFKFSYHPSPLLNNPGGVGFQGQQHIVFDDYEGQTLWFGIKVGKLLPDVARQFWPSFLGIALGYGARNITSTNPERAYFIGLDVDMREVIPNDTPLLRTLGEALNFFRMPLPAIQLTPNTVWYGIYF